MANVADVSPRPPSQRVSDLDALIDEDSAVGCYNEPLAFGGTLRIVAYFARAVAWLAGDGTRRRRYDRESQ